MFWLQQSAQLWHYPQFTLIPLALLGLLECLAGYQAWRFLLFLNGAVIGGILGTVSSAMVGLPAMMLPGCAGGAIAGAVLFGNAVPLGSFAVVLATTGSMLILIVHLAGLSGHLFIPIAVASVACGIAAVLKGRPVIIAVASIGGAQQVASSVCAYFMPPDIAPQRDVISASECIAFFALALLGLCVQLAATRPKTALAAQLTEPRSPIRQVSGRG